MSSEKALPKVEENAGPAHPGQAGYDASCKVCHETDSMGAPAVGDKAAWAAVLEKGKDAVYSNAINGINGMPPKGGAMNLTDAQIHEIVDYMVESSK
jgi:cytochrome c